MPPPQRKVEVADAVRALRSVALSSRCAVALTDQVEAKRTRAAAQAEEDRRLEAEMEAARLKALAADEDRERQRREAYRQGALVICAQREERAAERRRQQELERQERQAVGRHLEALQASERTAVDAKRASLRQAMGNVATANAAQMEARARAREAEAAEERRMAEYHQAREQRDEEWRRQQAQQRMEREREAARLGMLQEKARDVQAEADALRDRRAQAARHREARQREQREHERAALQQEGLKESWAAQIQQKGALLATEADLKAQERRALDESQLADAAAEQAASAAVKAKARRQHAILWDQLQHEREQRKGDLQRHRQVERDVRSSWKAEELWIEEARRSTMQALAEEGVPEKLCGSLLRNRTNLYRVAN